jgi:predicted acetyltransferase
MNELELQLPALHHKIAAQNFKNEFFEIQEQLIPGSALFDQMEYDEWLIHNTNNRHENTVAIGWVVATTFFAIRKSDHKMIGMIDVRHNLGNEFLAQFGGHLGYSVCPSERKKGYATEMLKMALEYTKSLGIEKVMIACFANNIPSIRTIEKCGGVFTETKTLSNVGFDILSEEEGKFINIYWVDFRFSISSYPSIAPTLYTQNSNPR